MMESLFLFVEELEGLFYSNTGEKAEAVIEVTKEKVEVRIHFDCRGSKRLWVMNTERNSVKYPFGRNSFFENCKQGALRELDNLLQNS